jgi:hypothetical protein
MANMLDRITEGVANVTQVHSSAVALVHNIANQITSVASNSGAAEQLAAMLHEHAHHLADHVLAGTPVIAATPPVHAEPSESATSEPPLAPEPHAEG